MQNPVAKIASAFLTDTEVAALVGIHVQTFRRLARNGPAASARALAIDWRMVDHIYVGRIRRWRKSAVLHVLGIGEEPAP